MMIHHAAPLAVFDEHFHGKPTQSIEASAEMTLEELDETGYDWAGSDEVYAVFSDLNPTLDDLVTAENGDVDAGETRNFGPNERCIRLGLHALMESPGV